MIQTESLYKITKRDIKKCAEILADAFEEDPIMRLFAGGSKFDKNKLISAFKFFVRASLKYDYVYGTSQEMEGIIIWLPENITYLSTWDFFTCGGIGMILKHGFKMPLTMMKYENFTAQRHNEHIKTPHWYLLAFAVRKEHRKKGYAGKLMRPFIKYFDTNNIPAYLETGEGNNEAMYKHYGFELVEQTTLPDSDIVFKAMLRNPTG